ncbi:MAG: hypothetical protein WCV90_08955 [Candidatus Woesearchaeota archaeon]
MIDSNFIKGLEIEIRREEEDFRDLMNDFEFVKELNKELSLKYQDFVDSLPKLEELDIIINILKENLKTLSLPSRIEHINKRIFQLTRFRSAVVLLEKDDPESKPIKYEELFRGKE